jgi:hypothetical protein
MVNITLEDRDWLSLLRRIEREKCTPFLGAGINYGILPLGSEIAQKLAESFHYPLKDCLDLARVTQFLAVTQDPMFPKEEAQILLEKSLEQWEKTVTLSDFFKKPDQPLGVLADLPIPIYMTTNYDDLMIKALKTRQKDPKRELCRWNAFVRNMPSLFDSADSFEPTPANPVVFHLHGYNEVPESLVLTEDDYFDFLVNVSRQEDLLPPRIQQALAGTSLLFIGYRLADWDFRVIFRGIVSSMEGSLRRESLAVQLPPEDLEPDQKEAQQEYLTEYFGSIDVKIFWGTAQQFAAELRDRWDAFTK